MRIKRIVLIVLVVVVLVGLGAAIYIYTSPAGAPSAQARAQVKQAPSSADSNAATPTRSAQSSQNSGLPRAASTGVAPTNSGSPRAASTGAAPATSAPAIPVSTSYIAKATGNLTSANQATLAFQAGGRIKEIKVKEGDRVKAGDILASLDTTALDANIVQAQAALDSAAANLAKVKAGPTADDLIVARTNLDRAKVTMQQAQTAYDAIAWRPDAPMTTQASTLQTATAAYQGALSQYNQTINHPTDAELKAAQATFAQAQASLETAKMNAANARITAPFDGTVVWLGLKLGESTSSGTAAITIADLPRMQVQVNVDEISGSSIKVGQSVSITLDSVPGKVLTGRVAKIGLLASTSGNIVSTPVTIDVDTSNVSLYPGLSATVEFQARTQ